MSKYHGRLSDLSLDDSNGTLRELSNDLNSIEAPATGDTVEVSGFGDTTKDNVSSNVAKHMIRMAETRAVARALRFATNVGMYSTSEILEEKDTVVMPAPKDEVKPVPKRKGFFSKK